MQASIRVPRSSELLRLCIRLYLSSRVRCYVNYIKGGRALFEAWYLNNPFKVDDLGTVSSTFPIVCMCGTRWSSAGSAIIYGCDSCNRFHWDLSCEFLQLSSITRVPQLKLENLFSQELEAGYGYKTPATQLLLPLTTT